MSGGSTAPGRRLAARPPRVVDRSVVAAAGLVVLAFVLTSLAVGAPAADPVRLPGGGVQVDRALAVCPSSDTIGANDAKVLLGAAPIAGLGDEGTVGYAAAGTLADAEAKDLTRGELRRLPAQGSAAFEAEGEVAAGLFGFRVDRGTGSLAVAACPVPRARWWFTGAGATVDHQSELVLANIDPGPAVVDVTAIGPDGAIDTVGTRGLTVPPGETVTLAMIDVAPQSDELAVLVNASRGRVTAAMADSLAPARADRSAVEWIPPQAAASRVVRLGGIKAGADAQTLVVGNPSRFEALVDVQIAAKAGSFAPTGNAQLRVPPDSVVTADFGVSIPAEASAVRLRSSVPVTATLRSTLGNDTSYAGALTVLDGPAVIPVVDGADPTVQVTAGTAGATVELKAYDDTGGELGTTTLEVTATATASWKPGDRADYVVVTPGAGRVTGAVSMSGDAGLSQVPLQPLSISLRRPVVVPALR